MYFEPEEKKKYLHPIYAAEMNNFTENRKLNEHTSILYEEDTR